MSTRSKIIKVFFLSTAIVVLLFTTLYLDRIDQGKLLLTNSGQNLGAYRMGTKVAHSFKIWNLAAKPANIITLAPSCLCSVAKVGRHRIPPMSSTYVQMEVDTQKLAPGKQFKIVQIGFEDGRVLEGNITFTVASKQGNAHSSGDKQ